MDSSLVALVLFLGALIFTPGPALMTTASGGLTVGFWRTLPFIMGVLIGHLVTFFLAGTLVKPLFINYPLSQTILSFCGLSYMLYLAYRIYHNDPNVLKNLEKENSVKKSSSARASGHLSVMSGLVLMMLNPKAYVIAMLTLSEFGESMGGDDFLSFVKIAGIMVTIAFLSNITWLTLASTMRHWITSPSILRGMNRFLAVLLAGVVIWLFFR